MGKCWFHYYLVQEDRTWVARCLDIDVASDGDTASKAMDNLLEALTLYGDDLGWEPMLIPANKGLVGQKSSD